MMKINVKENKGITIITLLIAVVIMLIISSILIYNAETGIDTRALNNMYNDIKILKDKVDIYYAKYEVLPIIQSQYTNVNNFKTINVNDNENYYVVDLQSLDNLTLTYGKDYYTYKTAPSATLEDIYVINEKSHTIYYVAGINLDERTYYTVPGEYTKIEISTKVNPPKLSVGMIPVKWNDTQFIDTTQYDNEWYDYIDTSIDEQASTSKWANVRTQDGSMWVWIPRYAYKITYYTTAAKTTVSNTKTLYGDIDIVFLKGNTNYDYNGNDVTSINYVDEKGITGAYIVHPAFRDGRGNGFVNGEWDEEITGFWMAKFEAGYDDVNTAVDSPIKYTVTYGYKENGYANITSNYYSNNRVIGSNIKYPVFKANRPSMNNIGISDAYNLSRALAQNNNPYGISDVDSHLTKNSEWGAVVYLTHSKYGRNGEEVRINNVSANGENTVYAVTGYGASTDDANEDLSRNLTALISNGQNGSWLTTQGQLASSTGNIYGIYDLNGGLYEWTSGYIATEGKYEDYGGSLKGDSTKYKTKYAYTGNGNSDTSNYLNEDNINKKGEAIWETSTSGTDLTSWNNDYSKFWNDARPFSIRGGSWDDSSTAGIFAFERDIGGCHYWFGFRPVVIVNE